MLRWRFRCLGCDDMPPFLGHFALARGNTPHTKLSTSEVMLEDVQPRNGSCKPKKWYNLLNFLVFPTKISNAEQLTTVQQFQ